MGSSRLPGKVLLQLCGRAALLRMVERVRASASRGTVVVAATTDTADDVIEEICGQDGIECFRGHPTDLLDRHYQVGLAYNADAIVKIPSDCPLIDPRIIDKVIGAYTARPEMYDYIGNLHPASYPDGNDVEIFSMEAAAEAWNTARDEIDREHTTPFLWRNPDRFRIGSVVWETGKDLSASHRWTLDYWEDYLFIKEVYEALYATDPNFGLDDILLLLNDRPAMKTVNADYIGETWYTRYLANLSPKDRNKETLSNRAA